jgi:Uma2 family endonuclease
MTQSAVFDHEEPKPSYGRPMSIEEWEQMDEDEPVELVNGRMEEEEMPDSTHEVILSALLEVLFNWARARRSRVLSSELKYALDTRRGRKPDISIFFSRDRKLPQRGATRFPPDVMIEIASPRARDRRRDRVEKLREYATFGVRWYWLIDPAAQMLEILRLGDDGHYVLALSVAEGTVEVPGCEGLTLDLDALWREVEEQVEAEKQPEDG